MDDLTILNELHKGITMGMSAIEDVSEKVSEPNFKDELSFQYNRYRDSLDKVDAKFEEAGKIQRRDKIQKTLDDINKKYGDDTIKSAALFNKK